VQKFNLTYCPTPGGGVVRTLSEQVVEDTDSHTVEIFVFVYNLMVAFKVDDRDL